MCLEVLDDSAFGGSRKADQFILIIGLVLIHGSEHFFAFSLTKSIVSIVGIFPDHQHDLIDIAMGLP